MSNQNFVDIRALSILHDNLPSISVRLHLDNIESLRIEREKDGFVTYSIYLSDGNVFSTCEEDGMKILEMLRERTAEQYKK